MVNGKDGCIADDVSQTAFEWRVLIASGNPSSDELADFHAWRNADPLHADAYDRAISVFEALGTLEQQEIDADIYPTSKTGPAEEENSQSSLARFGWRSRFGALAASIAITASIVFIIVDRPVVREPTETSAPTAIATYETDRGETRTITLADGSEVTLGAASELSVSMSPRRRRLSLERGAALFDVAPDADRPLSVEAGDLTATALGTIFEVRHNGGVMRLAVSEGDVEVSHPLFVNDTPVSMMARKIVAAGEQIAATQTRGLSPISALPEDSFAAWKEDRLTYVGATLNELIADANRYSERRITLSEEVKAFDDLSVTVTFDGRDIDTMLELIPDMFPVKVDTASEGQIVIRRR
ncbi:MAG: FecR domain-containing protein [Pseudomonadota bacterium]